MSWEDIPGWFDFQDIYLEAVKEAPKNGVLVEVGVAFGRSLAFLARAAIDAGRHDLRIIGVDPWRDTASFIPAKDKPATGWGGEYANLVRAAGGPFNAFVEHMLSHAREELDRVEVWRMTSYSASTHFSPAGRREISYGTGKPQVQGPLSFVFIDADHTFEGVCEDIGAWTEVLRAGVIAGHDYTDEYPGVVSAVRESFGFEVPRRGSSWWVPLTEAV